MPAERSSRVDPNGQEARLSLRKYHVDVHIENGFARTTIDQTYFNHQLWRMEGTFYFPLPADASLSRLAMYVGPKLMEGGMAEREHARDVFEQIVYSQRDPALLEWVDGSTFKMRVFPLEGRQEKRIVISYTQKLAADYGQTRYRFPAGHNLEVVRDWSAKLRVKDGGDLHWESPSHEFKAQQQGRRLAAFRHRQRRESRQRHRAHIAKRQQQFVGVGRLRIGPARRPTVSNGPLSPAASHARPQRTTKLGSAV